MFFAEMGSRVIKVENPATGGDVTRSWRGPVEDAESPCAYFSAANWGKESIGVDLGNPDGRCVVHDLVRRADVVIVSYKAGDAARFGVDWETLSGLNPQSGVRRDHGVRRGRSESRLRCGDSGGNRLREHERHGRERAAQDAGRSDGSSGRPSAEGGNPGCPARAPGDQGEVAGSRSLCSTRASRRWPIRRPTS